MIELLRKLGYAPRHAVWELTLKCNMRCRHCASRAGQARDDELSLTEARRLCRELAALGCQHITLSGGEPLLRPDWALIAATLVDLGITTAMISNGTVWNRDIAQTLRAIGIESMGFSLDGFAEAHDYQRRREGHFAEVLRTIDSAMEEGLVVTVVTTVNNRNRQQLEEFRELLAKHGVPRWQIQFATPTGNMAENRGLLMAPEDLLETVPVVARMCRDGKPPNTWAGHNVGYYGEPEESLRDPNVAIPFWVGCLAGISVIGIESNGNIKGCLSLPSELSGEAAFVEGNVREKSLSDIWCRPGAFAYNREFTVDSLGGFCRTCEYNDICRGGCTWTCYSEQGFVRDNPYCYFRQQQLRTPSSEGQIPRRLPIV